MKTEQILLISVAFLALGMASPPPPVTYSDPVFNQEIETKISASCSTDCVSRNVQSPNCVVDCSRFTKWGLKYSDDK